MNKKEISALEETHKKMNLLQEQIVTKNYLLELYREGYEMNRDLYKRQCDLCKTQEDLINQLSRELDYYKKQAKELSHNNYIISKN